MIVDLIGKDSVALPPSLVDASAVTQGRVAVGFELARARDSQIPTWYLGPAANADTDLHRNLRICLLRMHAEQEVLDRIITWVDDGELDFHPGSDAAQRLESYVDRATQLLDSTYKYGLKASAVRDAYAVGAAVSRADIVARRRQGLDGMRLQIRRKAEAFAAERDALRPQINIVGGDLVEGMKVDKSIHAGDINAPIAIDSTQTISNSFNAFAANRGDQDELLQQMTTLRDSITALVQALAEAGPGRRQGGRRDLSELHRGEWQAGAEEGDAASPGHQPDSDRPEGGGGRGPGGLGGPRRAQGAGDRDRRPLTWPGKPVR